MILGRVTGTVVATRKDERLEGFKLLVVQAVEPDGRPKDGYVVAVDTVDAGVGDLVLVVFGKLRAHGLGLRRLAGGRRGRRDRRRSGSPLRGEKLISMQLAKVVGSVVATVKDPALESRTLLVIQPIAPSGVPSGEALVAIDGVGAGAGEEVIFVKGREAAFAFLPDQVLADAAIVGKVDSIDLGAEGSGARPAFAELRRVRRSPKGGGGSSPSSSEERGLKK